MECIGWSCQKLSVFFLLLIFMIIKPDFQQAPDKEGTYLILALLCFHIIFVLQLSSKQTYSVLYTNKLNLVIILFYAYSSKML